jgi:UDP-N-acetylglucosamine 2-epimerase (non-hydrolysing)
MREDQTLAGLTSSCIVALDSTLAETQPDCVVVQGDTTTVAATSIATFYRRIPVIHVEAGLRTGNLWSPWPEEFNRRLTTLVASMHCAPTELAASNLVREGAAQSRIHVTGNTVIDALLWTVQRERNRSAVWEKKYEFLDSRPVVLITGHRRENFGAGFREICEAIQELGEKFSGTCFVYPVHLNPRVRETVFQSLGRIGNVFLLDPVPYPEFVWLMDRCTLILSDSGGVQEEAPTLRKPVLLMRDTTERPEAVNAGAVELVGTDKHRIVEQAALLLTNPDEYRRRQIEVNPFGDGHAAKRIVKLIRDRVTRLGIV